MEEEYKIDMQEASMAEAGNGIEGVENLGDQKEFGDFIGYDEGYENDEFHRGRGAFRNGRGRTPHAWLNGPPRFRGRGYGPQGPPMRGRGFFRSRGVPRFPNAPNFDNNWGPMGPPPPGMMGGPPPFGPPPGMMPGQMGPPPNMMGQPPPYGGPPPGGMTGIPNMPNPELWVETKSEDGKSYFYHARTRETTWTRPQEGPGINNKVVTQAEIEAMAASGAMGMMPQGGPQQQMPMGMGPMANGGPMMQPGQGPPYMNQPPPWMKDAQNQQQLSQDAKNMAENDEMPPGESAPIQQPPMNQQPPINQQPLMNQQPQMNQQPPMNQQPQMNQQPPMNQPPPGNNQMGFPGMSGPPNFNQAPPNFNPPGGPGGPGPGGPPGGFPGGPGAPPGFPGGWGGWGGWPPPLVAQPPPNLASAAVPDSGAAVQQPQPAQINLKPGAVPGQVAGLPQGLAVRGQAPPLLGQAPGLPSQGMRLPGVPGQVNRFPGQGVPEVNEQPKKEEITVPPAVAAAAAAWTTHRSPDGRAYYYHAANQESVWEKPKALRDLHEIQGRINSERLKGKRKLEIDSGTIIEVIDVEAHAEAQAAAEAAAIAAVEAEKKSAADKEKAERERVEREKADKEQQEKDKAEKEKAEKEKVKADKSRPVSSTPISGTPWCVVWTGDGRVFFYNPTTHTSVWERPPQLAGRADVDKAVGQPPHSLLDHQKKDGVPPAMAVSKSANGETKRNVTDSDDSDSEPGRKKLKSEEKQSKQPATIDLGKEAAIEAEVRAARERGVVPHEQRLRSFQQMLHEKQVSAFSTWEKELHKIVFDPRYLMLNSKERRQVFDQYVRERAEEERKEKKNRLQQKKQVFRTLMEEAKLHSKSSFTEFASKHGRDERFKAIEKTRDREIYFNEYIGELRKKDKEDKEKKRELVKAEYLALLKEKGVDRHARFQDVKKKIDSDVRYKAVEGGAAREDYFREYCKQLKDDRRKDKDMKDRERLVKKDKKEKERDKEKDGKEGKEKKKKEKGESTEEESRKQPTPPPDQWADILGIPGEEAKARARKAKEKNLVEKQLMEMELAEKEQVEKEALEKELDSDRTGSTSPDEVISPKQLRSSKKETPTKAETIKSPPKKRKLEEFKSPEAEPEETKKKEKKKTEKKKVPEKTEKKKRKKTEKE